MTMIQEHYDQLMRGPVSFNQWRQKNNIIPELTGAKIADIDLTRVDLSNAFLEGAFIGEVEMNNANLSGARLQLATLQVVDLLDADLSGADLHSATLRVVTLAGASLHEASLLRTQFSRCLLDETSFDGARLGDTVFADVDLGDALGLASVKHAKPSSLDHRTLLRPSELPAAFLRGVGLPDVLISSLPSLRAAASPISMYSCFISYSSGDRRFARRLHDELQSRGVRVWLDEHQIRPGDDIADEVDRAIRIYDKMILCCSERSLKSPWVDEEINKARQKERELQRERNQKTLSLIPIDLDGYVLDGWSSGLKSEVARRRIEDFRDWEDDVKFEASFEKLIRALHADESGRDPDPERKL